MKLRPVMWSGLIFAMLVCGIATGQTVDKPKESVKPLTEEQILVYRAFLTGYLKGDKGHVNLADKTYPLEPDDGDFEGCMKQFPKGVQAKEIHHFTKEFAQDDRIHLVDADKYKTADVKDFMHRKEGLDDAVQKAFDVGLLSLSEVIFDSRHQLAAMNFSFHCGMLCGSGGTVIYELHHGKWTRSKRSCGYWQS